ncbi:MAG: hypothetical protein K2P99_01995 [Burkholderiales bacterium]|nr:hypothetical protein [Burkholderiales bacterium]
MEKFQKNDLNILIAYYGFFISNIDSIIKYEIVSEKLSQELKLFYLTNHATLIDIQSKLINKDFTSAIEIINNHKFPNSQSSIIKDVITYYQNNVTLNYNQTSGLETIPSFINGVISLNQFNTQESLDTFNNLSNIELEKITCTLNEINVNISSVLHNELISNASTFNSVINNSINKAINDNIKNHILYFQDESLQLLMKLSPPIKTLELAYVAIKNEQKQLLENSVNSLKLAQESIISSIPNMIINSNREILTELLKTQNNILTEKKQLKIIIPFVFLIFFFLILISNILISNINTPNLANTITKELSSHFKIKN